jgi:hypothetical protein
MEKRGWDIPRHVTKTGRIEMAAETHVKAYRAAVSGDEAGILKVFAEVASEVPTSVLPQTEGIVQRLVASGQSWVAVDADGNIVGYAENPLSAEAVYADGLGLPLAVNSFNRRPRTARRARDTFVPLFDRNRAALPSCMHQYGSTIPGHHGRHFSPCSASSRSRRS